MLPTHNWRQQIIAPIYARLNSWNRRAFYELVYDSYAAAMGYLWRVHINQSSEQCHCTFSNLFLLGILREDVIFIFERDSGGGGGYYPMKWCPIKLILLRKPSRRFWRKKSTQKTSPLFYAGGVQQNAYFYSRVYYRGCGQIGCTKTIR